MSLADELTSVRIDEMIGSLGRGVARAQYDLDLTSIRIARIMSGVDEKDRVALGRKTYSLLELGLTPTFYQFVDSLIEVKISITVTSSTDRSETRTQASAGLAWDGEGVSARVSSVNASYSSKYQYSAEGSSLVRTKLVPVPAPALLSQRILALANEAPAEGRK